jgi:ArsR family transcriptional regulator
MKGRGMKTPIAVRETTDPLVACCGVLAADGLTPAEAGDVATLFKALADPHRVRIVNMLATTEEPVCVCEFTDDLSLAQGTVSFHLKKLVDAGLIEREQRGTWAYYSLRPDALRRVADVFRPEGARR